MIKKIVSLFSGCGGLDLGFEQAGFKVIWANEFDESIQPTYALNFPKTKLDKRDIREIPSSEIPNCVGIIGGPPCQSWSEAGAQRGINDSRGQLFYDYIRILKDKQPKFFLAENVSGILARKHSDAVNHIIDLFDDSGYCVNMALLNTANYNVPQDRKRVIFVGFHKSFDYKFDFNLPTSNPISLRDAIWDLKDSAKPALEKNKSNKNSCYIPNHEYMIGGFSTIYMSRNRVRSWDEQSYTIQAGGRHAPMHPQSNKMINVGKDKFIFDPDSDKPYRRLSVRECARIQTFPDNFLLLYDKVSDGYKMIGNAVPVNFSYALARTIITKLNDLDQGINRTRCSQSMDLRQLRLAL